MLGTGGAFKEEADASWAETVLFPSGSDTWLLGDTV